MAGYSRAPLYSIFLLEVYGRAIVTQHVLEAANSPATFLEQNEGCRCVYTGCSCEEVLKFMTCIKAACNNHKCKCLQTEGDSHFQQACKLMSTRCKDTEQELECKAENATCDGEVVTFDPELVGYVPNWKYKAKKAYFEHHKHTLFAISILVMVGIFALVFTFAESSNSFVKKNTWMTIDFVVVTFVALSWYYVIMHFLEKEIRNRSSQIVVHIAIGLILLGVSTSVSWIIRVRGKATSVTIFNELFSPVVMWSFVGILSTMQTDAKDDKTRVFLSILFLMVFYFFLMMVCYWIGAKFMEKGWNDDTLHKAAGASVAAGFVHFSHMLVAKNYQSLEDPHDANMKETIKCNLVGVAFFVIAIMSTPLLTALKERYKDAYWILRLVKTNDVMFHFMPKYSIVLSLNHLIAALMGFKHFHIEVNLIAATMSTLVALSIILACAYIPVLKRRADITTELVGLSAFIIGSTWAALLNNSVGMMPNGALKPSVMKLFITMFLSAVILPTYWFFLKPVALMKSKLTDK